jgi:hypothetical protein
MDLEEIRYGLQLHFEDTADWRQRKAEEYPEDNRNLEAVSILKKLAESVDAVPEHVLEVFGRHCEGFFDGEAFNEALRHIGFHSAPATAEKFVRDYLADVTTFTAENDEALHVGPGHNL